MVGNKYAKYVGQPAPQQEPTTENKYRKYLQPAPTPQPPASVAPRSVQRQPDGYFPAETPNAPLGKMWQQHPGGAVLQNVPANAYRDQDHMLKPEVRAEKAQTQALQQRYDQSIQDRAAQVQAQNDPTLLMLKPEARTPENAQRRNPMLPSPGTPFRPLQKPQPIDPFGQDPVDKAALEKEFYFRENNLSDGPLENIGYDLQNFDKTAPRNIWNAVVGATEGTINLPRSITNEMGTASANMEVSPDMAMRNVNRMPQLDERVGQGKREFTPWIPKVDLERAYMNISPEEQSITGSLVQGFGQFLAARGLVKAPGFAGDAAALGIGFAGDSGRTADFIDPSTIPEGVLRDFVRSLKTQPGDSDFIGRVKNMTEDATINLLLMGLARGGKSLMGGINPKMTPTNAGALRPGAIDTSAIDAPHITTELPTAPYPRPEGSPPEFDTAVPPTAPRPQPAPAAAQGPAAAPVTPPPPIRPSVATQTAQAGAPPIPPQPPVTAAANAPVPTPGAVPPTGNLVPIPQNEAVAAFNALPPKTREAMLRTLNSAGMDANGFWSDAWRKLTGRFRNSREAMDAIRKLGDMPEDQQVMFALELMKNHGGDLETILPAMGRKWATEGARDPQLLGGTDRAREIMDANVPKVINSHGERVASIAEENFGPGVVPAGEAIDVEKQALAAQYDKLLNPQRPQYSTGGKGQVRAPKKRAVIDQAIANIKTYLKRPEVINQMPDWVKMKVMQRASEDMRNIGFTDAQKAVILAGDGAVLAPLFEASGPLTWSPKMWDHLVDQYPTQAAHILQSAYREAADGLLSGVSRTQADVTNAQYLMRLRGESGKGGLLDMLERAIPGKGGKIDGEGGYQWTRKNFGDNRSAERAFDILERFKTAANSEGDVAAIIKELKDLPARHREAAENQITSLIRQELGRKVENVKLSELDNPDRLSAPNLTALSSQNFLNALEDVFGERGKELADGIRLARASTDTLTSISPKYNSRTKLNEEDVQKAGARYEDPAGSDGGVIDKTVGSLASGGFATGAAGVLGVSSAGALTAPLLGLAAGKALYNAWKAGKRLTNSERNQLVDFLFRARKAGEGAPTPRRINDGNVIGSAAVNAAVGGTIGGLSSDGDPGAIAAGAGIGAGFGAGRQIIRSRSTIIKPPSTRTPRRGPPPFGGGRVTGAGPAQQITPPRTAGFGGSQTNASPTVTGALVGGGIGYATSDGDPRAAALGALGGGALGAAAGKLGAGAKKAPRPVSSAPVQKGFGSSKLPMDEASRMQRARAQGFDVDTPLYHGTRADFDEFRISEDGNFGPGVYLTRNPKDASQYAGAANGSNVRPVYVRGRLADEEAWGNAIEYISQKSPNATTEEWDRQAVELLKKQGYAGIDGDGQISIFDPSNIRGKFAKFDPAESSSSKLLAGLPQGIPEIAGGALSVTGAAMKDPDTNHDGIVSKEEAFAHQGSIGVSLIAGTMATSLVGQAINKVRTGFGGRPRPPRPRGSDINAASFGRPIGGGKAESRPSQNGFGGGRKGPPALTKPASGNKHGLEPSFRAVAQLKAGTAINKADRPPVTKAFTPGNADKQLSNIDRLLANHPSPESSSNAWSRMMADMVGDVDAPLPPHQFIKDMKNGGEGAIERLKTLTPEQIAEADHGFHQADEFRKAYISGDMQPTDTTKLFMWSFLSRGVSPYVQESMFLDAFKGADEWIQHAVNGTFDSNVLAGYKKWASEVSPAGSGLPGSGTQHNLNAFGEHFLRKMAQRADDGETYLKKLHDMIADPNMTGPEIRRAFSKFPEGIGIDNKVVSFTLLASGRKDVMVLDRIQVRALFNDGRFGSRNIYDPLKKDGAAVAGTALGDITYGAHGIVLYEAIERALAKQVDAIYAAVGRPQDASIGRYHWDTWNGASGQEASHGTLGAILNGAKRSENPLASIRAKEGEYGSFAYNSEYGISADGERTFHYTTPKGSTYEFSVPAYREFIAEVKKAKNGVVPSNFKVTQSGNAPWTSRPEVNADALDALAARYADRSTGERAGRRSGPQGAGREPVQGNGQGKVAGRPKRVAPTTAVPAFRRPTQINQAGFSFGSGRKGPPGVKRVVMEKRIGNRLGKMAPALKPETREAIRANAALPPAMRKSAYEASGRDPALIEIASPFMTGANAGGARKAPGLKFRKLPRLDNDIAKARAEAARAPQSPPLESAAEMRYRTENARRGAKGAVTRWENDNYDFAREAAGKPQIKAPIDKRKRMERSAEDAALADRVLKQMNPTADDVEWLQRKATRRLAEIDDAIKRGQVSPEFMNGKPRTRAEAEDMARLIFDAEYADLLDEVLSGKVVPKPRSEHALAVFLAASAAGSAIGVPLAIAEIRGSIDRDRAARESAEKAKGEDMTKYAEPGDPRFVWDWQKIKSRRGAVQTIQANLNALPPNKSDGRFNLSIDAWGPKTEAAVKRWQFENGFKPTGELTQDQWSLLDQQATAARQKAPTR